MQYEGAIYRPPSEADSLILQVTVGCSHNKCTFCGSFKSKKFRVKSFEEIKKDVEEAKVYCQSVKKVFLTDGDALIIPQKRLVPIIELIRESFPRMERIGAYGNVKSVLKKSADELKALKEMGLGIIYLGVESGDQQVLDEVCKGTTIEKMVEAAKRVKEAGIVFSVTVLLGLGGVERSAVHAEQTGKLLTLMDPDFIGALTIIMKSGTVLADRIKRGEFSIPDAYQLVKELYVMIEHTHVTRSFFASNHATNYLPLKVWLPEEKGKALQAIRHVLERRDPSMLRSDYLRQKS